jgi:hypothetical protein
MSKEDFEEYLAPIYGGLARMHQDYKTVPCNCQGKKGKFLYKGKHIDCPGWQLTPRVVQRANS